MPFYEEAYRQDKVSVRAACAIVCQFCGGAEFQISLTARPDPEATFAEVMASVDALLCLGCNRVLGEELAPIAPQH